MERLTQILTALSAAPSRTLSADQILAVVTYGAGSVEDRRDQLRRDVRHLETLGWSIGNVAAPGETARYRLTAVDNRLRLELSPAQRAELERAAQAAGLGDAVPGLGDGADPDPGFETRVRREDEMLARVQRAVAGRCRLHFVYRGKARTVHPHALHARRGGWYLTGQEGIGEQPKTFAVSRMSEVSLDAPGTAPAPAEPSRPQLDPITWPVDDPVDVLLDTTAEHRPHVENLLGPATIVADHAGALRLTVRVTHRAAFRRRLYELGTRVRLVGPAQVRDEVRDELHAVVRAGA